MAGTVHSDSDRYPCRPLQYKSHQDFFQKRYSSFVDYLCNMPPSNYLCENIFFAKSSVSFRSIFHRSAFLYSVHSVFCGNKFALGFFFFFFLLSLFCLVSATPNTTPKNNPETYILFMMAISFVCELSELEYGSHSPIGKLKHFVEMKNPSRKLSKKKTFVHCQLFSFFIFFLVLDLVAVWSVPPCHC